MSKLSRAGNVHHTNYGNKTDCGRPTKGKYAVVSTGRWDWVSCKQCKKARKNK